jgi:hypothetical protein
MQNPGEKPCSICFLPDTGRLIPLSVGKYPKTHGQIYTGVVYQEDS